MNSSSEVKLLGKANLSLSLLGLKALGNLVFCSWLDCLISGVGGEMFPEPDLEIMLLFCPFDFFPSDENLNVPVTLAAS